MTYTLTAIYFKEDNWYVGFCLQIPAANGQGKTLSACKKSLASAIQLMQEENAQELMEFVPAEYTIEPVIINEKNISSAIAYGKRMQNTAGRTSTHSLDKPANRSKGTSSTSQGNRGRNGKKDTDATHRKKRNTIKRPVKKP
jgi:predicted RNase H-like HicB family nuclease